MNFEGVKAVRNQVGLKIIDEILFLKSGCKTRMKIGCNACFVIRAGHRNTCSVKRSAPILFNSMCNKHEF